MQRIGCQAQPQLCLRLLSSSSSATSKDLSLFWAPQAEDMAWLQPCASTSSCGVVSQSWAKGLEN